MDSELQTAERLLKSHGYRACLYLPSAGIDDENLASACRIVARYGNRIILAEDDYIVGKVSADTLADSETGNSKPSGPQLRLVVSND